MSPQLMDLPSELIFSILGYVPQRSLLSCRLVNKSMSVLSAGFIYRRIYFAPRKDRLRIFQNIARCPAAKSVKELVYDIRLFREGLQNNTWHARRNLRSILASLSCEIDLRNLQYLRDIFDLQYRDQQAILGTNGSVTHLSNGLVNMSNIEKLFIMDHFGTERPTLTSRNHEWYRKSCYKESPEQFLSSSTSYFHVPGGCSHMMHMIGCSFWEALASNGLKLKELYFGTKETTIPAEIFLMNISGLNALRNVCMELKVLQLSLDMRLMNPRRNRTFQLPRFLKALRKLEELWIGMDLWSPVNHNRFITDQRWPLLKILNLFNFAMEVPDFLNLCGHHCDTLKVIQMIRMSFTRGDGSQVFSWCGHNLKLDRLAISQLTFRENGDMYQVVQGAPDIDWSASLCATALLPREHQMIKVSDIYSDGILFERMEQES